MLYSEIRFHGKYILEERSRLEKDNLIAASFSSWQILRYKVEKLPTWGKYLRELKLSSEPVLNKADLKREADQAMANAQRIIDKAKKLEKGSNGSR